MHLQEKKMDPGYLEQLYGVSSRDDVEELREALRTGEKIEVSRVDDDFFTPEAYRKLILDKVVTE